MSHMPPGLPRILRRLFQVQPSGIPLVTKILCAAVGIVKLFASRRATDLLLPGLGDVAPLILVLLFPGWLIQVDSGCSALAPSSDPSYSFAHPPAGGSAEHCTGDSSLCAAVSPSCPNPELISVHSGLNHERGPEPPDEQVCHSSSANFRPKECEARPQPTEVPGAPAQPGPRLRKPLPGTRATPVTACELWAEWFGALSASDCELSIFFHSLRELLRKGRGPSADSSRSSTRRTWPMPLPYPELLIPGSPAREAGRLGMNAIVLVLNGLFLGQPVICRPELQIDLGQSPSPRQWRRLELLKPAVERWNRVPTVGPSEMGRAAAKYEGLEDLLASVEVGMQGAREKMSSRFGTVRLKLQQPLHALPVDCDRIKFVGVPTFDPRPFLDNVSRRIYEAPLAFRKEVPPEVSVPRVQVRTAPGKKLGLLQALDRSSRLTLIPSSEVKTPYRNGLFAVAKDEARDRLVLDARAANLAEGGIDPWIQSLGSLEQLQHLYVPPTHNLEIFCEDLREFYHAFLVSQDRCHRNALAMTLTRSEAHSLACCSRGSAKELLTPCLQTLAMGDSHAVGFGQTSHLAVVLRCSELRLRDFVTLRGRPPRSPQLVAGLLIDDLLLLDFVAKVNPERPSRGLRTSNCRIHKGRV